MSSRIIPVQAFDYIVFGATGDLTKRKLIPALYHRFSDGQFDENSKIIGVSRSKLSSDDFRQLAQDSIAKYVGKEHQDSEVIKRFLTCFHYIPNDVTNKDGWAELREELRGDEDVVRAFYMAVSPSLYAPICEYITGQGYWTPSARVVLEKPIGHDRVSANEINETVGKVFGEHQIYRIDHYLGKETVQNLLALRFANALFEPIWNSTHIDHIQITVAESIGVGTRGGYYDTSGALRDMVQNHLIQLLCLVAMEPPASEHADALRDEKLKVLRSLKEISDSNINETTVRGQYKGVTSGEVTVPGYLDELGPELSESKTETFVAIKAEIENWRWKGVPFYLRTGKRLANRVSEIVIQFRDIPHSIFGATGSVPKANKLVLRLQPDEGVKLLLMIKDPGPGGMRLREESLNLSFADTFTTWVPDAYERLLMDVIRGNQTLFMRRDELDAAWSWIDPIRQGWDNASEGPQTYSAGTWGPTKSIALIERDGRTWYEDPEVS